jgi:hypothetical protein
MDIMADVLRWIGIAGVIGWMALNVFVGYELLVKNPSATPLRNRRTSTAGSRKRRRTTEQQHSLRDQPAM